jgi:hypothetical protein
MAKGYLGVTHGSCTTEPGVQQVSPLFEEAEI